MGSKQVNYIGKTFGDFEIIHRLANKMEEAGNIRAMWAGCCQRCYVIKEFNQRSLKRNKNFKCQYCKQYCE